MHTPSQSVGITALPEALTPKEQRGPLATDIAKEWPWVSSIVRKAKYKRVHLNFICESGWHRFQSAAASAGFLDVLPQVWASSTGKLHGGGVLWLRSIHFYTNIGQTGTSKEGRTI